MSDQDSGSGVSYEILRSLRQIVRAISLHSRRLSGEAGLTVPQLLSLKALHDAPDGVLTASGLAATIQVSPGTATGIVDRLVRLGLVARHRREDDRRKVYLELTGPGQAKVDAAPRPLQERFTDRLMRLDEAERANILAVLQQVVTLMEADDIDAAPILTIDPKAPARR